MIAGPSVPGVGVSRYQPGRASGSSSDGTWTVPSGLRPSSTSGLSTPMAGTDSVRGAESGSVVGAVGAVGAVSVDAPAEGTPGAVGPGEGSGSAVAAAVGGRTPVPVVGGASGRGPAQPATSRVVPTATANPSPARTRTSTLHSTDPGDGQAAEEQPTHRGAGDAGRGRTRAGSGRRRRSASGVGRAVGDGGHLHRRERPAQRRIGGLGRQ